MATYYFSGTARWAKVQPDQLDLDYDKKSKSWKIDLHMDDESWELFEESGCQLKVKEDKETKSKYVNFRRPERKLIKDKIVEYTAPDVLGPDNLPIKDKIGNGSKVTVKVEIYGTAKGKGHELKAVRVEELVPYNAEVVVAPDEMVPF